MPQDFFWLAFMCPPPLNANVCVYVWNILLKLRADGGRSQAKMNGGHTLNALFFLFWTSGDMSPRGRLRAAVQKHRTAVVHVHVRLHIMLARQQIFPLSRTSHSTEYSIHSTSPPPPPVYLPNM